MTAGATSAGRASAATAGGLTTIVSIRNSVGTDTNTGPLGAAVASWHARWTVCGRRAPRFRAKVHFAHGSMSRAGPPVSVSTRSHCRPTFGPGGSPKPIDSPASTTIGMRSCSAARTIMVACSAPTVVCRKTAGSFPVALA